ncbi:HAMP domain-containing protein [candidate division KSB1 bacterium]|nr:HAMP domain-containing protein [candidate division KSB1 bacterium]
MQFFLLWLTVILIAVAAYLAFLWWHPRKRSRFQVRLTSLFLLFSLLPTVPLIFVVSTLATDTADVLLVPEVESAFVQAIAAIKLQSENTGKKFIHSTVREQITPELLASWGFDYYAVWQKQSDSTRTMFAATHSARLPTDSSFQIKEVWGQTGSSLSTIVRGDSMLGHCRVWSPRSENEMALVGFALAPEVLSAKEQLTQTLRVYNSLSLIKERVLQEQVIWGAAIAVIGVLCLLSVFVARKMSHVLSRPIDDLISVTNQVAAGDLNAQSAAQAKDEIRQLVEAFNTMIRDLRVNREKLLAAERLAAWREVARQVSHEIKNPLTPIQLALYRLKQRLPESMVAQEAVRESLQSIEEELASFKHLAEEFSSFARLPRAELKPENLNEIVQATAHLYEADSRARLELQLAPELPACVLDREQIKRLLNNLIKNAMEACANQNAVIRIATNRVDQKVRLEISDNGPGLSAEARTHLFEPNFTTKRGGSGLGLVMVKRIVEEHGAVIEVDSEVGKGTRFVIKFAIDAKRFLARA